jgi:predicted acylesterase/phospholipase RssA
MCSTLAKKGESVLLRSYHCPEDAIPISSIARRMSEQGVFSKVDITSAARATSAAPIYLPPEDWDGITFWDGGVLNNNPIEQLWNARYDLVAQGQPPPPISCVLSLGCGWTDKKPHFLMKVFNTVNVYLNSFMANTEAKNRDFARLVQRMTNRNDQDANVRYFRLNVYLGSHKLNMADPTIIPELEKLTRKYIETDGASDIQAVAELIARRKGQ